MYIFKDDDIKLKTGERTIYYIMKYGIDINENEFHAIVSLDKMEDDKIIKTSPNNVITNSKNGV